METVNSGTCSYCNENYAHCVCSDAKTNDDNLVMDHVDDAPNNSDADVKEHKPHSGKCCNH